MKRQQGFTLLELVVALTLLTLLSGLMFGGFRLAGRTWETVERHNDRLGEQVQLQLFLRNLLSRAEPRDIWDIRQTQLLSFQGREDSLLFLAPLPHKGGGPAQPAWFYLALDETEPEHPLLLLKTQPVMAGNNPEQQAIEPFDWYRLLDDFRRPELLPPLLALEVDEFKLHYQAREEDNRLPEWQTDWLEQERLPALIRLQLAPDWPALVIAPGDHRYEIKDEY
ncbi:prepilin-type N-terminal cleavage/methylation domain-containing protein [Zobellella iuensis]|uniref:Prepilin-type N-terminal cleavage/methylation domain-containing protein n=1 Tax=Zobellella iuensis TaxID=2803811 RepID=A0ABS1QX50_9GAMM|nr:prepilin-type N-terminal cleavage/methylation domain-containing protein [Zobellella iuensis]MBL1379326.1 prepilin-type N-terminal cleavage/methylation domain-containing protein [Zobellella iuensis]